MKKQLIAIKVKDGYVIEKKEQYSVKTLSEVMSDIRYSGLKHRKEFSTEEKIYAD
jgi:hypothetical protein